MKLFNVFIVFLIVFLFTLVLGDLLFAQPSFPDDPDQIPIDGGLALLAGTGTIYAIRNLRKPNNRFNNIK